MLSSSSTIVIIWHLAHLVMFAMPPFQSSGPCSCFPLPITLCFHFQIPFSLTGSHAFPLHGACSYDSFQLTGSVENPLSHVTCGKGKLKIVVVVKEITSNNLESLPVQQGHKCTRCCLNRGDSCVLILCGLLSHALVVSMIVLNVKLDCHRNVCKKKKDHCTSQYSTIEP